MTTYVIGPNRIVSELALPAHAIAVGAADLSDARLADIGADLARGGSLIAIGSECLPRLRANWVDTQPCASIRHRSASGVSPAPDVDWGETPCRALCVRPDRVHTYFGADEMPRAEVLPLVEAVGTDGAACAYSALWIKHYAPSLVGNRYDGANLYLFALDDPAAAAPLEAWQRVVSALAAHAASCVAFTRVRADRALYHPGESGSIRLGIANRSPRIASVRLEITLLRPDGSTAATRKIRRCLNSSERIEAPWEFMCPEAEGLWRVGADMYLEDRYTYGDAREADSVLVERTECAFVVAASQTGQTGRTDPTIPTQPSIEGRSFSVGDSDGFLAGTHYYPSSSWWDWAWRDFRPEHAARDSEEMARHGYSFVRVWIDPELDEQALRGIEAWLHLSAASGIVSIVCIFTQWSRTLAYPDDQGAMVSFDFATTRDFNVYSVQLTNIEHQRRYLGVLARRWAHLPNVIWNLSNEVYIVDPSPEQLDPAYFGDVEPKRGPLAGQAYMNRWADLMTETLRAEGATQPVLRGYGFVTGGDCYLQNRDGAMLLWHHYESAERAGPCLAFAAPGLLEKPLIMEEFGIPTLDEEERLERYEGIACWSVAMGASGACAYEWGVSWLAPELPFMATPLRDASLGGEPDPRWMDGQVQYSASWPIGSMGLCPWAASFAYGSNLPCTPCASPAAIGLGSVARFCSGIGPPHGEADVLLVVPMEWREFAPLQGYMRILDPTVAAVQALASRHVPFSVVQEDQVAAYPGKPRCVVYPATQTVSAAIRAGLERLSAGGARVLVGAFDPHASELARHAMEVTSDRSVWALRRRTRAGSMIMLFAPNGPANVALRGASEMVNLQVLRYALVEVLDTGGHRAWVGQSRCPVRTGAP